MKNLLVSLMLAFVCAGASAQQTAIKTNLLYDATRSVNLGLEVGLATHWTFDLSANYNPWSYSNHRKLKHLLVQPEARYWFCEQFNGHFIGMHAYWAKFNVGGLKMPFGLWEELRNHHYEGDLYGFGFTYGYQWMLNRHWNIEAAIGLGYAHIIYDRYPCADCGTRQKGGHKNYLGPTKAAVSLVYLF